MGVFVISYLEFVNMTFIVKEEDAYIGSRSFMFVVIDYHYYYCMPTDTHRGVPHIGASFNPKLCCAAQC